MKTPGLRRPKKPNLRGARLKEKAPAKELRQEEVSKESEFDPFDPQHLLSTLVRATRENAGEALRAAFSRLRG